MGRTDDWEACPRCGEVEDLDLCHNHPEIIDGGLWVDNRCLRCGEEWGLCFVPRQGFGVEVLRRLRVAR